MAKTKNLGILGIDNTISSLSQIANSNSGITKPKRGVKYYDNGTIVGKKKNKKDEDDIRTIKTEDNKTQNTQVNNTPNKEGYIKTNQKYGYYDYHDYKNKKDFDIYKKDGKAYYYDPRDKTYNDMDTPHYANQTQDKKELKEAKKYGYKERKTYKTTKNGKRVEVLPNTVAERVELETSGLTKKEKKKYAKSLIKQKDKEVKKSSYVREGSTLGELKYMAKSLKENTEPLGRIDEAYDYGKLQQEMSLAYSDMLKGKKVDISKIQRKIDNYNKFNKDVAEANTVLDTYVKSVPGQLRGMKKGIENAGTLGTIGAIGGGTIGAVATKTPQGAVAGAETGAKWLGGAGYVKGQAQNTYELESGATYQTLLEMGVPDKIAKKEAKRVGTENALIESGESILDLLTFGRAGAATNALKEGLIKKYGAEALKKWGVSYGTNIVSEGLQEGTQEQRSIAAEKRAAKKAGIERDDSQDVQRILESAKAGGFGAAITGAGTRITGMGGSSVYNMTKQKASQMLEIQQQVNNGTMTHEEANQKIEQVNNGTYDKNKVLDEIATQKRDEVEQAAQQGIISPAQATQEIQALNNTLVEERNQMSRDAKIEAMQTRLQEMDVNGYLSNNYTDEQLQGFMEQVYDDNLSAEELQDNLYNVIFKDSAKKQATNILEISAKDTKMTREEFIKRHYTKNMDQDFDVTKEDVGKIYDKYHNEDKKSVKEKEVVKTTSQKSGKKGRSYQGKFYSDDNFNLLDDDDIKLTTKLMKKQENQQKLTKNEEQQVQYLRRKREGLKNPEINPDIKGYDDIKSDYKYVHNHTLTKTDSKKIQTALDIVSSNRQGRRTKQQWLDIANNIGMQSENLDSEALKNLAYGSWAELSPNQKDVLNRQGSKYVSFDAHEWVREVYKGAKVGTKISENNVEETNEKQSTKENVQQETNQNENIYENNNINDFDMWYEDNLDMLVDKFEGKYKKAPVNPNTGSNNSEWVPFLENEYNKELEKSRQKTEITNNQQESAQENINNDVINTKESKIRDDNGNLLKVYHRSHTKNIKQLEPKNGAIFFTDDPNASYYGNEKYSANLNIKNPLIIDGEGANFNQIKFDLPNVKQYNSTTIENAINNIDKLTKKDVIEIAKAIDKNNSLEDFIDVFNTPKDALDSVVEAYTDGGTLEDFVKQYGGLNSYIDNKNIQTNKVTTTRDIVDYAKNNGYDGVVFKNVQDKTKGVVNVYAAFNSDQIINYKYDNANQQNIEPKKSENIPAIKSENVISAKINDGTNIELKKNKDNTYTKEIKQPKDNKSIVPKEVMENQIAHLEDGTKLSNFYSNVTEKSKFITEENREKLSQEDIWKFAPQTNKETMQKALDKIGNTQKSLEAAYGDFLSKENFDPEDVAMGWVFLKRFQDAGNYDAMVQVAKKMRNTGATKTGRTLQMFNLQSRLTPEGMVYYAQSELSEAKQKYDKGKSLKQIEKHAEDFTLTPTETEYIQKQMEKIQTMEDGREKNIELAKINKMLSDKLPHTKGDSLRAWMRIAMLFNPKTQVRNLGGNAMITPVNAIADVPAAIADKAISKFTGVRTIGAPSLGGAKAYAKGFAKGGKEAIQDYKMDIDTKNVDISRFDITQKNPFKTDHKGIAKPLNLSSKVLNKTNKILDLVMSGGDRTFYQGAFENSLRNQMKLNKVDTPTQDMIDIAIQEGLSRTWNDNNDYTNFVLTTRRALNKFSKNGLGSGYGLGDILIPFAKTPANLTKAIVDYSPVGLTSTIFKTKDIKNAIQTGQITPQIQHEFAQNLGKGVAGTMLYGIAVALAKAGLASGSSDDDKDVADFIKNTMGIQPYSITINGKSFTYDWAQPIAAPLAIATDAYKNLSGESNEDALSRITNTILDVSNTGLNVLMQQSFLSGMAEVFNNQEGITNGMMEQVFDLPARGVPTFLKQINDMFDKTQRVSYERNHPLTTSKQSAMSKIPGQSEKLAPKVDTLGREIQKYGGDKNALTYALKSFLSPSNRSNARTSKVANEIYKVYSETGDKNMMPRVAPYYIGQSKENRIDLNSKQRAEYQKTSGKLVNEAISDLITNQKYQNLSYDDKAQVINKIVGFADAKAKESFTGKISNYYAPANRKISQGMPIADYYLNSRRKKR